MLTCALPVLVTVTVCGAEVPLTFTLPNARLVGVTPKVSVPATPVPPRLTGVGEVGALLTIERLPEAAPTAVGRNATLILASCPAPRFNGKVKPLSLKAAPDLLI